MVCHTSTWEVVSKSQRIYNKLQYLSIDLSPSLPSPVVDALLIPQWASDDRRTCHSLTAGRHCNTDTASATKHSTVCQCQSSFLITTVYVCALTTKVTIIICKISKSWPTLCLFNVQIITATDLLCKLSINTNNFVFRCCCSVSRHLISI